MLATSGSLLAAAAAAALLAATLLAGDAVFRALAGVEAAAEDVGSVFAAGVAAAGTALLLAGEVGWLRPIPLLAATALLAIARRHRIAAALRALARWRPIPATPLRPHEAVWLAIVVLVLFSSFVTTLTPEVTFDALAYHLPAARDTAARGAVEPLPDVLPQTLFWRGHQTFLSLGFFLVEGERIARLLQFAVGLALFAAASALRRRLAGAAGRLLVPLALVSLPLASLQMHSVWADWPAALLVTASAAEIAAPPSREGRSWLAGFLFGGAVAIKIFAVLALPALVLLWWRRRGARPIRAALGAAACALVVLAPWAAWSASRGGGILPYVPTPSVLLHRWAGAPQPGTAHTETAERERRAREGAVARFLRLPYDLTFHGTRWEGIPDGYNGMLPLLLVAGTLGWGARRFLLFALAALAALVPWNLLYAPSVRYLFPVLPLYFVFAAAGLDRLTGEFAGGLGAAAGLTVAALTLAYPAQFFSLPYDSRVALGRTSREEALAAYLPSYPLWRYLGPRDRVLFSGEWDRFHCPAERAWRVGWFPVGAWGEDPTRWKRGIAELGIRYCVLRTDNSAPIPLSASDLELVAQRGPAILYRVRSMESR